jgi:hypothetical protein
LASPLYTAVREWAPTASVEVASEADPLAMAAEPKDVVPSRNCTVPVADDGDIAAANVTRCPKLDGLALELSVEVVVLNACVIVRGRLLVAVSVPDVPAMAGE